MKVVQSQGEKFDKLSEHVSKMDKKMVNSVPIVTPPTPKQTIPGLVFPTDVNP